MSFSDPALAYLREFTRYTRLNELIDDINELRSLYELEHDLSNAEHNADAIGWMPAKAFGVCGGITGDYHVRGFPGSFNVEDVIGFVTYLRVDLMNKFSTDAQVIASYIGPNAYRPHIQDLQQVGSVFRVELKLIDTSDNVVNTTSWTEDDAIAFAAYYNGDWSNDTPSMSNSWQGFGARVVNQVFGRQSFNKMVNNLYTLKEALSVGHVFSTGRHEPYKYMGHGARAFARWNSGTPTGFNVASVETLSAGVYRFILENPINIQDNEHYCVIPGVEGTSGYRATVLKTAKNSFDIGVYDTSDALVALGGTDVINVAAWRYI